MDQVLEPIKDKLKQLVEITVPAEESESYANQMIEQLEMSIGLRLLEKLPQESRLHVVQMMDSGQIGEVSDTLMHGVDNDELQRICQQEFSEQLGDWVREIVPYLSENQAFRLRHKLSQI